MKANDRIQQAMRANEEAVLAEIRRNGSYESTFFTPWPAWHHAIDRLRAAGVIRRRKQDGHYVLIRRRSKRRRNGV